MYTLWVGLTMFLNLQVEAAHRTWCVQSTEDSPIGPTYDQHQHDQTGVLFDKSYSNCVGRLIPDTSCPVMRDGRLTSLFLFLGQIVQEEVDQDGINFGTWIVPCNLSADHFHGPDAAAT